MGGWTKEFQTPQASINDLATDFLDHFNDGSVFWGWRALNGNGSIAESNDALRLSIPQGSDGDWWDGATVNAARVGMAGLRDLFVIETKITEFTGNDKTEAGIFYSDGMSGGTTNVFYLSCYRQDSANINGVFCSRAGTAGGAAFASMNTGVTNLPLWLRIRCSIMDHANSNIFFDYSYDGTTWTQLYAFNTNAVLNYASVVGLYVKNFVTKNAVSAAFDYFKMFRPLGPR